MVTHDPSLFPQLSGYNPLRNLTMSRVLADIDASERGDHTAAQWLYAHIERREPSTRAIVERRQASLGRCSWRIELDEEAMTDGTTERLADEQRAFLKELFGNIENLRAAWKWLGMAKFRGFAHLERRYDETGAICCLQPVEQWFLNQRYPSKQWLYDPRARSTSFGKPISRRHWLWMEAVPFDEIASLYYVLKSLAIRDWAQFMARFGIPNIFIKVGKDATVGEAGMEAFLTQLRRYCTGGNGVLPPDVDVEMQTAGASENTPFPGFLKYIDEMIVLAGTSGKLTMLSEATGIGSGATSAHKDAFQELAENDGEEAASTLHQTIAVEALDREFPGQPHLVKLTVSRRLVMTPKEVGELAGAIRSSGYRMKQDVLERGIGFEIEEHAEPGKKPDAGEDMDQEEIEAENRNGSEYDEAITAAVRADMAAVTDEIMRACEIIDPEARNAKLASLREGLPAQLEKMNLNPAAAEVLEEAMTDAFLKGTAQEQR